MQVVRRIIPSSTRGRLGELPTDATREYVRRARRVRAAHRVEPWKAQHSLGRLARERNEGSAQQPIRSFIGSLPVRCGSQAAEQFAMIIDQALEGAILRYS